jgi:hypothetical protein
MSALKSYFTMSKILFATGVGIGYGIGVAYVNPKLSEWLA